MFKKNLTRKNLSEIIHKNLGFSKNLSGVLVDDVFNTIISGLKNQNYVKLSSFGAFKVLNKKERLGRNPKTKEKAMIAARKVVTFKASKVLKTKVNE
tara:strand:+ start:371 stop:661 length:291 start_codon:yes stop_codon:yes gene_type:complete